MSRGESDLDLESGLGAIWTENTGITDAQGRVYTGISGSGPVVNFITWTPHSRKDSAKTEHRAQGLKTLACL